MNFLIIDQGEGVGKSVNSFVSMFHDYLETHNTDVLILFSDSYVEQNKNNAFIEYFQRRALTGQNKFILFNYLYFLSRHAKEVQ
jgi:hypothetical protein